ncbi:MAG TPA: cytidylate kinase-like family protein [Candidatus Alistipes intestinipullorum]|nr:cytidylate kinase-like family protein [Candidatus Alistipes intestinipullorum]
MEREKFVINIGRQLGSGGKPVGEIIARRLGIKLYDKELINLAARESGLCPDIFEKADEKGRKGVFATLVGYLRAPFAGYEGGNANNILANESLFRIQSDVIREIASRESAIFVGRCADYILRDNPRCVNVFITADEADRCARLCAREGWTPEEARSMMERTDSKRASYYNYYSSRTWGQAATYDLCVNSSVLGDEGTADLILEFAARKLHEKF